MIVGGLKSGLFQEHVVLIRHANYYAVSFHWRFTPQSGIFHFFTLRWEETGQRLGKRTTNRRQIRCCITIFGSFGDICQIVANYNLHV